MATKPALKVLIFYIIGLLLGKYFDIPAPLILLFVVFSFFLGFTLWYHDKGNRNVLAFCLAFCTIAVGVIKLELAAGYFQRHHIIHFTNQKEPVAVYGQVVKYPTQRLGRISLTVAIREIFIHRKVYPTQGKILVNIEQDSCRIRYGDAIILRGKLRRPRDVRNPGEFDYRAYLEAQGVFGIMYVQREEEIQIESSGHGSWLLRRVVIPAKDYLHRYVKEKLPDQEAAVVQAMLIGERGEILPSLRENFSKMGVIHILAVSGMHVGFVMIIFMGVLSFFRMPYWSRVLLTLLGLVFYVCLTDFKPPVLRASIMGGIILLGTILERRSDVLNSLAIAALVILIWNPVELFQSGFQLSFAAVGAIVLLYPKFQALRFIRNIQQKYQENVFVRYPLTLVLVSASAFVGTVPFTALYFDRLPNFSLLANLIVVPLAFCGLANAITASIMNLFSSGLADLFLSAAWLFIHLLVKLTEWAGNLPFSYWEMYKFSFALTVGYFVGLALILHWRKRKTKFLLLIYVLLGSNLFVWQQAAKTNGNMQVLFFDVGQGDATLLEFPDGRTMLIDAGPRGTNYDAGQWIIAPYLKRQGRNRIDVVVVSHADADHVGGVPYLLRHFRVGEVWDTGVGKDSQLFNEYAHLVDSLQIKRNVLRAGEWIPQFEPVKIFVLHPRDSYLANIDPTGVNNASLVLKISYGTVDFLFPGDIEKEAEQRVVRYGDLLESEVLKVPHHGSNTSSCAELLRQVEPEWAVISVGEMNRFDHPSAEVLQRLNAMRVRILRTDRNAAVLLQTDGKEIEQIHWK